MLAVDLRCLQSSRFHVTFLPGGPLGQGHEHRLVLIGLCWPDGRIESLSLSTHENQLQMPGKSHQVIGR